MRAQTRFRRYRVRRVPLSCYALLNSFLAVLRASGVVFLFCAAGLIFGGAKGVGSLFHVLLFRTHFRMYRGRPIFMFCTPRLIFGCTEGVVSSFNVLSSRTHFRRYRGRRVRFSCFALPESFSAVAGAWGPFFLFCAPDLNFRGTEGGPSHFHVFRSRTCFRRNRGRRVPFSSFALPYSFSKVPRASGAVFTFCAPGLIFGGTEGVGSRFHVFCSWTLFRR
jgi:hypothetical protein